MMMFCHASLSLCYTPKLAPWDPSAALACFEVLKSNLVFGVWFDSSVPVRVCFNSTQFVNLD